MATDVTLFTCPMCAAKADNGVAFRDHLAGVHQLVDDPGTDTVASLQPASPPADEDEEDVREAGDPDSAASAEAPATERRQPERAASGRPKPTPSRAKTLKAKAQAKRREPSPPRERRPRSEPPRPRRAWRRAAPRLEPGSRYPLALHYGDIALYVPAFVLFAIGVFDDHIGLTLTAVVLAIVAMLLPVAHGLGMAAPLEPSAPERASSPPANENQEPAAHRLEETLLTLPRPSAAERPSS